MDTIDISNLNRQFLFRCGPPSSLVEPESDALTFRQKDVGRPKAIAAAEFIMRRVPGCTVTPYYGKIQDKDDDYYMQFNIVICGLDSVEARRWMNATLVRLVDPEVEESLKPLIDGGTEGMSHSFESLLLALTSLNKQASKAKQESSSPLSQPATNAPSIYTLLKLPTLYAQSKIPLVYQNIASHGRVS